MNKIKKKIVFLYLKEDAERFHKSNSLDTLLNELSMKYNDIAIPLKDSFCDVNK